MTLNQKLAIIRLFPKSNLETYKSPYYGYPLEILIKLWELVDVKREDLKIAVVDDFGLEAVNFLLDKGIQLDNITMIISDEKSFEKKKREFEKLINVRTINLINFFEKEKGYYTDNNMFDLIIANPPYGNQNCIAKQILKKALDFAKKLVVLVPKNTFKDKLLWSKVEEIRLVDNCFEDAAVQNLAIAELSKEANNTQDFERLKLNKKQCKYLDALYTYNKERELRRALVKTAKIGNIEKKLSTRIEDVVLQYDAHLEVIKNLTLKEVIDAKVAFVYTIWTPLDGVHTSQAHDWTYNLQGIWPDEWKYDCPVNIMIFATKLERNNFRDWWYSCLEREKEQKLRSGLTNFILDILRDARSSGGGGYDVYFPNLDWSHPWTDKEILKEIGLPEDFLEKETK